MSDLPRCPICEREVLGRGGVSAFGPFCSARCRSIDLGNWLEGRYCIAAPPEGTEDGAEGDGSVESQVPDGEC